VAEVVALMAPGRELELLLEWERGAGVASAELGATWCALEIKVAGQSVTLVEDDRGGGLRRSVHTSAYPLAEWIATHWWGLHDHLRPSATSARGWAWARVATSPWLRGHNLRAAGDGMPWPDLTIVPEGAATRLVWRRGPGMASQPVTFLTAGDTHLPTNTVRAAMVGFVEQVLDRLADAGVKGTLLHDEWAALTELAPEERQFMHAAARLGLDPFDVRNGLADQLQSLEADYDSALFDEFLNSADPERLPTAARWVDRARGSMNRAPFRAQGVSEEAPVGEGRPWDRGYAAAQACRARLGLPVTSSIDLADLVGLSRVEGDPAGLHGLVEVADNGLGLALPTAVTSQTATRFAQARALGLSLLTRRPVALLDPTHADLAQQTRAFAAEVLAPADGIADFLSVFPSVTERALDAVADRFGTSPLVVQHQYENQLA